MAHQQLLCECVSVVNLIPNSVSIRPGEVNLCVAAVVVEYTLVDYTQRIDWPPVQLHALRDDYNYHSIVRGPPNVINRSYTLLPEARQASFCNTSIFLPYIDTIRVESIQRVD